MSKPGFTPKELQKLPGSNDRLGWHYYYAKQFRLTGSSHTQQLAAWYLSLYLSKDGPGILEKNAEMLEKQKAYLWILIGNKARNPDGTQLLLRILERLEDLQKFQESIQPPIHTEKL